MHLFVDRRHATKVDMTDVEGHIHSFEEKNAFFLITIRILLFFIKNFSFDFVDIESEKFKENIDKLSEHYSSETNISKLKVYFEREKNNIIDFIKREKEYLRDREDEFKNIIDIFTDMIYAISTENKEFNIGIHEKSAKLEEITHLNDIRRIREELKVEIGQLQHFVREKQARDAQHVQALAGEVESLRSDFQKAKHALLIDGLTGACNRAAFDQHIQQLVERSTVTHEPFALLLLDIDDFKQINDTYGHPVGDRVLIALVQQCRAAVRQDDFIARYGGEEFALVFSAASLRLARKKARALCKAIASTHYTTERHDRHEKLTFTVSIGVSTLQQGDTVATMIERADKALYEAKRRGKNRVVDEKQVA